MKSYLLALIPLVATLAHAELLVTCHQPGGKGSKAASVSVERKNIYGSCYVVWSLKGATTDLLAEANVIHSGATDTTEIVGELCSARQPYLAFIKNSGKDYRIALENLEGDGFVLRAVEWKNSARSNQVATVYFGACSPSNVLPSWRKNL